MLCFHKKKLNSQEISIFITIFSNCFLFIEKRRSKPSQKNIYNKNSNKPTIQTILITIEIEFTALASPVSPPKSFVKAGAADPIGLNGKIASALLTSTENGSKK